MLENPESFKYDFREKRKNFEDWTISRQPRHLSLNIYHLPEKFLINDKCSMISEKKALRDYTPHTQPDSSAGDEIVQTTTPKSLAVGESRSGM